MVKGRFFGNQDIEIYFSLDEFLRLGKLEIKDNKIVRKPIEVMLERDDNDFFKATIQVEDFEDSSDGIKVDRNENEFDIRINDRAYWRTRDNSCWGTRYGIGAKVIFYVGDQND